VGRAGLSHPVWRTASETVRRWLHRFNRSGLEGLDDLGGQGRKRRITEAERSRIIALVKQVPPGRLEVQPGGDLWAADPLGPAEWTLDSLAARARQLGIEVGRYQVRKILIAEGVRWRRTRSWARSKTRTSREKDADHRPLHPAARRCDGHLRRRAGAGDPAHFRARTCLVTGRAPDQSGARLQPRAEVSP
jgi:transposase